MASLLTPSPDSFGLAGDAEITLEANPGTVTAASLAGYRAAGVNRLSLGLQSLDPQQLTTLGRLHSREEGLAGRAPGPPGRFRQPLPRPDLRPAGADADRLDEELDRYLDLAPEHLSCYGLTAEPDTPFHHRVQAGELRLPDEEFYADAFLRLHERLTAAGYGTLRDCQLCPPGARLPAQSRLLAAPPVSGRRRRGPFLPGHRLGGALVRAGRPRPPTARSCGTGQEPAERIEGFDRAGAMSETLYLGLRTRAGVDDAAFRTRFGCGVAEAFPQAVAQLQPWLALEAGSWRLTVAGWLLYDRLIQAVSVE